MTDNELWISFLNSFDIGWHLFQEEGGKRTLQLRTDDSKIIGYRDCVFEVYFDKDGKFVETGIWEV